MASVGQMMYGDRKSQHIVRREELPALVRQLRLDGTRPGCNTDRRRHVATTPEKAWEFFRAEEGRNDDWKIVGSLQGRVSSTTPARWNVCTNGGAWVHAAAGWWRTREEAWDALERAIAFAYGDIFAERAEQEAIRAAGAALREEFRGRLEALEVRRQAAERVSYPLYMTATGFSTGGLEKPYTVETIAEFEAEIVASETRRDEKATFDAAAPAFVERLVALGVQCELRYNGVHLVVDGIWKNQFPSTKSGLTGLEAYVLDQERHHRAPVEVRNLDLSGMFGGAVKIRR